MTFASPYKGLEAFADTDLDALLFFGREREREIVVANLIAARLTILYGPTGVGKSSLLRAGVARALRELPEQPLVVVFDHWGDDPSADLAAVVAEASGEDPGKGLLDVVERAQQARDVYLVLDQAEEYFVYHQQEERFDVEIARLVGDPLRVNVLLSLREDSLAKLDRFKARIPYIYANSLRLDRLDREEGRMAIVRPVERWNELENDTVNVEPPLVEAVLDGVRAGRIEQGGGLGGVEGNGRPSSVEAPYLQLVMQRVWEVERAADSHALRAATLAGLGGARQVVADHLDRAIAELSEPERDVAAQLFTFLVTPSGTKIAHDLPDLAEYAGVGEAEAAPVVDTLSRYRILRPDEAGRIEIFHDVLAAEVLAWRRSHNAIRALEQERAEARRRHRRLAWLAGLAFVALVLTVSLAAFAWSQRNQAQQQAAVADQQTATAKKAQQGEAQKAKELQNKNEQLQQSNTELRQQKARADENAQKAHENAQQTQQANEELQAETATANSATAQAQTQKRNVQHQKAKAVAAAKRARRNAAKARTQRDVARHERLLATARALREKARALEDVDPVLSLRFALRAARIEANFDAEDVLRSSLVAMRERHVLPGGGRIVRSAAYDPRDSLVVLASGAGGARLFRARTGALVRLLDPRFVWKATFSNDGRLIATADGDGKARLWDAGNGRLLRSFAHSGPVRDVAFSADDRFLVTASVDWTARVWLTNTGASVSTMRHGGPVIHVAFDPNGDRVVTVSGPPPRKTAPVAQVFDAKTGNRLYTVAQDRITSAKFSKDGSLLVTTSADRSARLWNAKTGDPVSRMNEPSGHVVDAEFSPGGDRLVLATDSGDGFVWDVQNPSQPERLFSFTGATSALTSASYSPDGRLIVATSRDESSRVYLANSGLEMARLVGHNEAVTSASFSHGGSSILTASNDGTARIWSPPASVELTLVGSHGAGASVNVVHVSPDGTAAISAGSDATARIWDLRRHLELGVLRGHTGAVLDAEFSPDGRLAVTASIDGTARIWRVADSRLLEVLRHDDSVTSARFSPNGTLVATASDDGTARIWRVDDGRQLAKLPHSGPVTDVSFSPNGRLLVTASADREARLWAVPSGRLLRTLRGHRSAIVRATFSPDGRLVLTASRDHTARLWRVADGAALAVLRAHTRALTDAEFSPNGKLIVTASVDRDARIWSVRTGQSLHTLRGHASAVNTASFSPDGRWVVTGAHTSAGLWEVSTGRPFSVSLPGFPFLRGHQDRITSAEFAPNSRRIVTGSLDGTVRTYSCAICGRLASLMTIARLRLEGLAADVRGAPRRSRDNARLR